MAGSPKVVPSGCRDDALHHIRHLFAPVRGGASRAEIATALQADQWNLSRVLPARGFKPFSNCGVQYGHD